MNNQPNILYIMCDQFRYDCIAALGNGLISTPNLDRLVKRGVSFTNAYSPCPVCVAARYIVRTGRDPHTTGSFSNARPKAQDGQPEGMEDRCGPFLARTMGSLGYRTFGVGKFHAMAEDGNLGFDEIQRCEEIFGSPEHAAKDAYSSFIRTEHPEYDHIEQLHGERTEMYYMPQTGALPAELTVEAFVADRAVGLMNTHDARPWFGFVSFIAPHPPLAPPIPYNRMYNPDRLPNPVRGDLETDHMDEYIPWMNHLIWAEDVNDHLARVLKSRYYGEISYLDHCIGKLLDAVEALPNPDNVLIAFFTDHGDHMGDHHAWQKESWFEASAKIPFLVSWPQKITGGVQNHALVSLTDLFAIATSAAGALETRDGIDVLGMLEGTTPPRDCLFGLYGTPGTPLFKIMVRQGSYKYNFFANGGRRQLFDLAGDPGELRNLAEEYPGTAAHMHTQAVAYCKRPGLRAALDSDEMKTFAFEARPLNRINQMAWDRGVKGFSFLP